MKKIIRRQSKQINIGKVKVGGDSSISVQTMTKTDTRDSKATLSDISRLALAGCDIIRLAVPDIDAANSLKQIVEKSPIPIIADIHFDHKLALIAADAGVNGLRLNPGNISSNQKVKEIVHAAKAHKIPIRVGVNSGSLDKEIKNKFGGVTAEALAESALNEVRRLEQFDFDLIKIAVKAFELDTMINAVKLVANNCSYPLHLGVTEAGLPDEGIIRSSIGIGSLLLKGIGDTIRVSLTGDSATEIRAGIQILKSLGLRKAGPVMVSCPTCGRCQIPLQNIAQQVKHEIEKIDGEFKVAVMGCIVNGPGEAEQADFGIAGGKENGLIFKKGKIIKTLPTSSLVEGLISEIKKEYNKNNGDKD